MAKNIVICCDGTNNEFGRVNTNVVRLFQSLDLSDPRKQVGYYDPGVGTIAEPGAFSKAGKLLSQALGLAFGRGLIGNVEEAYTFLMSCYEPGDRIYLFGFSRGAYTVRALAGVLHLLGLLPDAHENLVPYVAKLAQAINDLDAGNQQQASQYWQVCRDFRMTFAATRIPCPVHFIGVWDTVSSVGWVWEPQRFPFTASNPSVRFFRHAVSIDERRCFFRQNLWHPTAARDGELATDVSEAWFPGVHSDVGGGYDNSFLWVAPFAWLTRQARHAGMVIDVKRYRDLLKDIPRRRACWREPCNVSLTIKWYLAEVFPKLKHSFPWLRFGMWGWRKAPRGARLHFTAVARLRCAELKYAPKSIPPSTITALSGPTFPARSMFIVT